MRRLLAVVLSVAALVALADTLLKQGSTNIGPVTAIACGNGMTCSRDGGTGVLDIGGTYQTYGALTLYMDPTGNDSNACTDAGVGACLTLNGVYARIPQVVRHNVTVNVAAGSYAFSSRWDGLKIGTVNTSDLAGPLINIAGPAMTAFAPATGTASGTLTAATTGSNPAPVFTDSTQSWTVNDLRGQFMTATSGALSGKSMPIIANTATTITTQAWGATNPLTGVTYAIQTPAATITGSQSITGITGTSGTIRFTALTFTSSAAGTATMNAGYNEPIVGLGLGLVNCRVIATGASGTAVLSTSSPEWLGSIISGGFYAESATGMAVYASAAAASVTVNSFVAYSGTTYGYYADYVSRKLIRTNIAAETGGATATAIQLNGLAGSHSGLSYGGLYARCPSGSTGVGIKVLGGGLTQNSIEIVNCGTGLALGPSHTEVASNFVPVTAYTFSDISGALTCTDTATCIGMQGGTRLHLAPAPTLVGVTNEYVIDGTSYTEAFFNALAPRRILGVEDSLLKRD